MFPLILPATVAAFIARNEIVPKTLPDRIVFFDRKAGIELAAYKRANALRLRKTAAFHLKRHRAFRDEAARLRAYQSRLRPAIVRPIPRAKPRYAPPPPTFRPAIQRPPPMPSAAPMFQQGVYGPPSQQQEEAPAAMEPSSAKEAMEATAAEPGAEPGAEGFPWVKVGLAALGGFVLYKVVTRKKGAKTSSAAAA